MMHFTKKFYVTMFAICCMSQTIQPSYMCDQDGRTELMNYVIQQEAVIKVKKVELDKLCDKYFMLNQKTKILEKRVWATDADVADYRKVEDEYDLLIEDTIENIKIKAFNGAGLQARDFRGRSVSDYCYTCKIYYTLRDLGAPCTLNEQTCEMIIVGIIAFNIGMMVLATYHRMYFPQ